MSAAVTVGSSSASARGSQQPKEAARASATHRSICLSPSRRELLALAGGTAASGLLLSPASAWGQDNSVPQDGRGRVALVTGASSGIGLSVAEGLLRRGYTVVPAARSLSKAKATADLLLSQVPGSSVECLDAPCDLSSLHSVDAYASAYASSGLTLDALVECAGIAWCDELKSDDGLELQFATNHLGHFHLANRLMPTLRAATEAEPSPRLIVMSSSAHYAGTCDPSSLIGESEVHRYNRWLNYCDSKLCNVLFASEAARREAAVHSPVLSAAVHPGIVNTNLIRYITPPGVMKARQEDQEKSLRVGKLLGLRTPEEGAQGTLWLATSDASQQKSGGYYDGLAPPKLTQPSQLASDPDLAAALWAASEVLVSRALGSPVPTASIEIVQLYNEAKGKDRKGEDTMGDALPGFLKMQMSTYRAS